MSSFDDREHAFENKFAHDEQVDFAVEARCAKLFGLWVAEQIGLKDGDAKTYALQIVEANLDEAGFGDILKRVRADLENKNISLSDHILEVQLDKALQEARKQIHDGTS